MKRNKSKTKEKKSFGRRILGFFKFILIIGFIGILFVAAVNIIMVSTTKKNIKTVDEASNGGYDCIIVLGAGIHTDGSPTDMLADRITVGVNAWKNGASPVILMSGDHGRVDYDEVNNMKKYAAELGADEDSIFLDHAGFSTYDTMYRARDVFGAKKVLIVTQEYHLYRALYIAKSLGLEADGVSANLRTYRGQSIHDAREMLARTKDMLYTWFKPLPTYLGDPIDLKGSAVQTNG